MSETSRRADREHDESRHWFQWHSFWHDESRELILRSNDFWQQLPTCCLIHCRAKDWNTSSSSSQRQRSQHAIGWYQRGTNVVSIMVCTFRLLGEAHGRSERVGSSHQFMELSIMRLELSSINEITCDRRPYHGSGEYVGEKYFYTVFFYMHGRCSSTAQQHNEKISANCKMKLKTNYGKSIWRGFTPRAAISERGRAERYAELSRGNHSRLVQENKHQQQYNNAKTEFSSARLHWKPVTIFALVWNTFLFGQNAIRIEGGSTAQAEFWYQCDISPSLLFYLDNTITIGKLQWVGTGRQSLLAIADKGHDAAKLSKASNPWSREQLG